MPNTETALLVVDAQESFRHRPYWVDAGVREFSEHLQALINGAQLRRIPVLQIFTEATLTFPMTDRRGITWSPRQIKDRTELVLDGRFARIVSVAETLAGIAADGVPV
jgi:hypothetical protein